MKYYSLNKQSPATTFKNATVQGQAPDRGLYFPEMVPQVGKSFIDEIEKLSDQEIAYHVIKPYVGDDIPAEQLFEIVKETVHFSVPLVPVTDSIAALELFHGNTLAFKDIGARFMSRCLGYFLKDSDKKVTVLVATSGDTGGAVADGFYGVEGVDVVILYPSGKVSTVQEKQLTTLGNNIHALEINGTFDDCQRIVKQAFADKQLCETLFLTSANSINIARWLPQQFFYFFAYKQWADKEQPLVMSVPSGNFGNICAGLLAKKSGLPIAHFIAACNANDVVPTFMATNVYTPKKSVATISNAMDVGDPSNFIRILELFKDEQINLPTVLSAYSISDDTIRKTIKEVYAKNTYLLDPHGAVAHVALSKYQQEHPGSKGIFMETAHPVKFYDVVEPLLNIKIPVPMAIQNIMNEKKYATSMEADFNTVKGFLMDL